jgi:hypothetical protein
VKTEIPCVGVEIWSLGEYGKVEHSKLGALLANQGNWGKTERQEEGVKHG